MQQFHVGVSGTFKQFVTCYTIAVWVRESERYVVIADVRKFGLKHVDDFTESHSLLLIIPSMIAVVRTDRHAIDTENRFTRLRLRQKNRVTVIARFFRAISSRRQNMFGEKVPDF